MARPEVTALVAKIREVTENAARIIKAGPELVDMADNTLKLGGKTYSQVTGDANTIINNHINNLSNPHGVVPNDAGMYDTAGIAALYSGRLPVGRAPIDMLGSQSYLPLAIAGSFEGATQYMVSRNWAMVMEGDGTLVYLRNGTNGSKFGVFYSYMENARAASLPAVRHTTTQYSPAVIAGLNNKAAFLYQSGHGVVAGRMQNSAGVLQDCFICLTNGTMDQTQHKGVTLPAATWAPILDRSETFRGNNSVFIIRVPETAPVSTKVTFDVYEIPLSAFDDGGAASPTKIIGWACTGFLETFAAQAGPTIASRWLSNSASDKAMILSTAQNASPAHLGMGRPKTFSRQAPDGTIRSLLLQETIHQWITLGYGAVNACITSFQWNPVAKTSIVDGGMGTEIPMTVDLVNNAVQTTGFGYKAKSSYVGYAEGDVTCQIVITDDGYQFTIDDNYYVDNNTIVSRAPYNAFVSAFDALNTRVSTRASAAARSTPPRYGSTFGSNLQGACALPDGKILMRALALLDDGVSVANRLVWGSISGSPNFTYNSLNAGRPTIQGWAPNTDRKLVNTTMGNDTQVLGLIADIAASGVVRTYTSVLIDNYRLAKDFVEVNSNLGAVGSGISVTQAQIDACKAQINAVIGYTPALSRLEVVVSQNTAIPVYAVYMTTMPGNNYPKGWLVKLNASSRSGAIATLTFDSIISEGIVLGNTPIPEIQESDGLIRLMGPHTHYETADGYMICGHSLSMFLNSSVGWATNVNYRFYLTKATGVIDLVTMGSVFYFGEVPRYFGWPGYGIGITPGTYLETDYQTKLVWDRYATTRAQFQAWTKLDSLVVASQDVPEGWVVYFNEVTPFVLKGTPYNLPVKSIDLRTVVGNPASKTFNIYAQVAAGVPNWIISDQNLSEATGTGLFKVGTVTTGTSGITAIAVAKGIKIGGARLSEVAAPTSIPVTAGNPAQTASHWN